MDPRIAAMVDHFAQANGVPINLARALVMQESGGNPNAKSPAGAGGVMQLMPATAKGLGVTNVFDPQQNIAAGMRMLGGLLREFKDPKLALAAYNAGSGAVRKYGGIPPYAETQNYVRAILANAGAPTQGSVEGPSLPQPSASPGQQPAPQAPDLAALLQQAAPSKTTQSILERLGGTAGRVAERAMEPIPLPQAGGAITSSGGEDPYAQPPSVAVTGAHENLPMVTGGKNVYTNLHFAGHVDFQHVSDRLLDIVNKEAKKRGLVVTVISGYRNKDYNSKVGGAQNSNHMRGLAIDAYVNGHPIGEVIPPEVWAKYGVRSGNTPGFFKGKPDPEHLDLMGVPVKQASKGAKA